MIGIDHIFIWSPISGKEIERFKNVGFNSIISGSHEGQGTSGEYIFFLNFYIEVLYISNDNLAQKYFTSFSENYEDRINWRKTGASPFGLGLKMNPYRKSDLPFEFSEYKAKWIKEDSIILPHENSNYKNPFIFLVPPYMEFPNYGSLEEMNKDDKPDSFKQNHVHDNKIEKLTSFKLIMRSEISNSAFLTILTENGIQIEVGSDSVLELEFDRNRQRKTINMNPDLPIIIKY